MGDDTAHVRAAFVDLQGNVYPAGFDKECVDWGVRTPPNGNGNGNGPRVVNTFCQRFNIAFDADLKWHCGTPRNPNEYTILSSYNWYIPGEEHLYWSIQWVDGDLSDFARNPLTDPPTVIPQSYRGFPPSCDLDLIRGRPFNDPAFGPPPAYPVDARYSNYVNVGWAHGLTDVKPRLVFFMDDPGETWSFDQPWGEQNYVIGPTTSNYLDQDAARLIPWSVSNTSRTVTTVFQKYDPGPPGKYKLYFSSLFW